MYRNTPGYGGGNGGKPAKIRPLIEAALDRDPNRSSNSLAEEFGCSPAYAGELVNLRLLADGKLTNTRLRQVDEDRLRWLAKETKNKLGSFIDRVKKGVNVVPASEFVRWLNFSGISDLVLSEDGKEIRDLAAELKVLCNQYFRQAGTSEETEEKQVPMVNRKLDVLIELLTAHFQLPTREPKHRRREKKAQVYEMERGEPDTARLMF